MLKTDNRLKGLLDRDIPFWVYYPLGLIAIVGKLILVSFQLLDLNLPAPIDDGLMYSAALSLSEGEWFGEYGYLTISKHMAFALWEALLHTLGVPILVGNQAFIALACMLCTAAVSPLITKRWQRLIFFGVTFFNPTATAAFTLRPYRDSIFPWVCLCVFACFIAVALRVKKGHKHSLFYLIIGGLSLGAAYLFREDGYWILPFTVTASVITAVFIYFEHVGRERVLSIARLIIPYAVMTLCIIAYSAMNYLSYGRFIVSDFTSSEFAAAVGALARVDADEGDVFWSDEKISVTGSAREMIYENVPEFARLEETLESDAFFNAYGYVQTDKETGERYVDYSSGGFYWALRRAADIAGIYDDANIAKEYWQGLENEINRLCDEGVLPSKTGERTSTMPPIRTEYILPVIEEALSSFWFVITFEDTSCYVDDRLSVGEPKAIEPMEEFLYTKSSIAASEGTSTPYYHPLWLHAYNLMDSIRLLYVYLVPFALLLAFAFQAIRAVRLIKARRFFSINGDALLWYICLGIMFMIIFRLFIVAFVTVASFTIGTYVMYLGSVHPLIILYILLTLFSSNRIETR